MRFLARLRSLFAGLLHRQQFEDSMSDELRFHIDSYVEDLVRAGVPRAEALRRARLEFGGAETVRAECRQARGLRWLDDLRGDLRYAARMFRRNPGFAAVAVVSLGLGIGANTAIFTLVDTVLLKFLPVRAPEQLFFIDNSGGRSGGSSAPPYPCFERFRDHDKYFSGLAAFSGDTFKVAIDGAQEKVFGQYASGNYFDLLGVHAVLGRTLKAQDDSAVGRGGPDGPVGVISYAFWKRRFGGDPAVLGKTIRIGKNYVKIVGVTPPEFFGLQPGAQIDLTIPMTLSGGDLREKGSWWFSAVGRLRNEANPEQARSELDAIFQHYMDELEHDPGTPVFFRDDIHAMRKTDFDRMALVSASKGLNDLRRRFSKPLLTIMVIVGLVLLIGCANVANLLLARASARQSEMAVRLAVGASRGRLIRQMLTEGALLVVVGGGLGLLWARWGVNFLVHFFGAAQAENPIALKPQFDLRVLGFTVAIAVLTCLLFSLAPALEATRKSSVGGSESIRASAGKASSLTGRLLVALQVMLSLMLLCGAGLYVRTLRNLETQDAGFARTGVLSMQVDATLPASDNADTKTFGVESAQIARMWGDLIGSLKSLPRVQYASAGTLSPLSGRNRGVLVAIAGHSKLSAQDSSIRLNQVSTDYFEALGIRVVVGRSFTLRDQPNSLKVAILNETAARFYFGEENPLGRKITFPGRKVTDAYEVVGVSRDVRYASLRNPAERLVYLPLTQPVDRITTVLLAIRSKTGVGTSLVEPIRKIVGKQIPGGFVTNVATLDEQVSESLVQERLVSLLASFFGGLALLLACIGLYGVLSYAVVRRTRELGIRMALGASKSVVIWLIMRETIYLVTAGVTFGLLGVLALSRYIQSQLYGVQPRDLTALSTAVLILLAVAGIAAYIPALRAGRVDPNIALRYE